MKRTILFFSILLAAGTLHAQDIFKRYGHNKEPLTLSKGRYKETFINEEEMRIGTVVINTRTEKVVQFLEEDTTGLAYKSEATGMFLTMDPLCEKYPWLSPYVYCANNPMRYVDLRGDSLTLAGTASQDAINFMNTQLSGFYTFSMDANGLVSMNPVQQANQNGTQMTPEQAELANQLSTIIGGNGMTNVNFVANDNNVLVGDIVSGTVDMGDIRQFGNGQWVDQAGAFIHEVHEQYQVQVVNQGQQSNALNWQAHRQASVVEGRVTGNVYNPMRPTVPNVAGNGGTVTVPVRDPNTGQWHNVTIQYQNNNITGITR